MKLVKYSKSNTNSESGGGTSSSGGSGSRTENNTVSGASLNRTIWGQYDEGDDLDGHMTVNGDVHIQVIEDKVYDADDADDGEDVEEDTGGGNLFVDLSIKAKDVEAERDMSIGRHLYINYPKHPEHSSNKQCIGEILYSIESDISTNKSDISTLKSRVSNTESDISTLKSRVSTNETNIQNNADEIEKLKEKAEGSESDIKDIQSQLADGSAIDELTKLVKYGNYYHPIVIYSGVLKKATSSDNYVEYGCLNEALDFKIADITSGLMTIEITPKSTTQQPMYIYVKSVSAIQEMSDDTKDRNTYYKARSNGAHWFESWFDVAQNKTTVYLREFHNGNDDNDTWYSSSWTEGGGIRNVNLTIVGYVHFIPMS